MKSEKVLCAEMLLAKYFYDFGASNKVEDCLNWVKHSMAGTGVRKADIKEARKNLCIQSVKTENGYMWVWKNEISPAGMWELKSKEFLKCEN